MMLRRGEDSTGNASCSLLVFSSAFCLERSVCWKIQSKDSDVADLVTNSVVVLWLWYIMILFCYAMDLTCWFSRHFKSYCACNLCVTRRIAPVCHHVSSVADSLWRPAYARTKLEWCRTSSQWIKAFYKEILEPIFSIFALTCCIQQKFWAKKPSDTNYQQATQLLQLGGILQAWSMWDCRPLAGCCPAQLFPVITVSTPTHLGQLFSLDVLENLGVSNPHFFKARNDISELDHGKKTRIPLIISDENPGFRSTYFPQTHLSEATIVWF